MREWVGESDRSGEHRAHMARVRQDEWAAVPAWASDPYLAERADA